MVICPWGPFDDQVNHNFGRCASLGSWFFVIIKVVVKGTEVLPIWYFALKILRQYEYWVVVRFSYLKKYFGIYSVEELMEIWLIW